MRFSNLLLGSLTVFGALSSPTISNDHVSSTAMGLRNKATITASLTFRGPAPPNCPEKPAPGVPSDVFSERSTQACEKLIPTNPYWERVLHFWYGYKENEKVKQDMYHLFTWKVAGRYGRIGGITREKCQAAFADAKSWDENIERGNVCVGNDGKTWVSTWHHEEDGDFYGMAWRMDEKWETDEAPPEDGGRILDYQREKTGWII